MCGRISTIFAIFRQKSGRGFLRFSLSLALFPPFPFCRLSLFSPFPLFRVFLKFFANSHFLLTKASAEERVKYLSSFRNFKFFPITGTCHHEDNSAWGTSVNNIFANISFLNRFRHNSLGLRPPYLVVPSSYFHF